MIEEVQLKVLTSEDRQNLLSKTAYSLPDNPSDKQFSAKQIKRKMYEGIIILFDWLRETQTSLSQVLTDLYEGDIPTKLAFMAQKDSDGNVITSTYETKSNATSKYAELNARIDEIIGVDFRELLTRDEFQEAIADYYTKLEVDSLLGEKVDKVTTSGSLRAYTVTSAGEQAVVEVSESAEASTIPIRSDNGDVLVPSTPVSESGATSKSYVDSKIATAVASVYRYKGSVAQYVDLPSQDLVVGDVYNVTATGDNYAWDGEDWDNLSGMVNLTGYVLQSDLNTQLGSYYTKSEANTLLDGKEDNITVGDGLSRDTSTNTISSLIEATSVVINIK